MKHALYYLWSFEHQAFWCGNRDGYTNVRTEAGLYTLEIASQIVESARGDEIAFVAGTHPVGHSAGPDVIAYDPQATLHLL